jgi:hypothetical protein
MFQLLRQVLFEVLIWKVERFWRLRPRAPRAMPKSRFEDPVYKRNVRELIERHKRFEDAKE